MAPSPNAVGEGGDASERSRGVAGEQGDGPRVRIRWRRQDDDGRRPRPGGRGRAGRQGPRADRRPGAPPGRCAGSRQARQRGDAGARRSSAVDRDRRTRRAVGGDARHQGRVGRADPPPRARRSGPRLGADQPAVPEHHEPLRAQPRLPRHGAAARGPLVGRLRPRRRRHAAVAQRPRRPRRPVADGRLLRQPVAPLVDRAVSVAAVQPGVEAVQPDRRPGARFALPPGHRRVLHPLPGDGARLRDASTRGRGVARRPAHDVRRRHDAGGRARPRGRLSWSAS